MSRAQPWALVGTGIISRSAVPDLMVCDGVEVAVGHSRNPDKAAGFAAELGIPRSIRDHVALLADDSINEIRSRIHPTTALRAGEALPR